jgi:hypothetical protein
VLLSKYNESNQVKGEKMDTSRGTNDQEQECIKDIGGKDRKKETIRKSKT